jgi:hypothetical protein
LTRLWVEGEPVEVWGGEGTPGGFKWNRASHRVQEVCNRWRAHALWWEPNEMVWREYLKVVTNTGLLCLIYRDLLTGSWYLQRRGCVPFASNLISILTRLV